MPLHTSDILEQLLPTYRQRHRLSPQQAKKINLLQRCRTPALGGHTLEYDDCYTVVECYNSCRNGRCPKYQRATSDHWLGQRRLDILPAVYFHVLFTLPHCLSGYRSMQR